jgi:ketosteroid isomerase-like protein
VLTERAEFVASAHALDSAFVRNFNAGEVDRLVAVYFADDALVLPPGAPLTQGHGQIRDLFRKIIDVAAGELTLQTRCLHVARDLGCGVGAYTLAIRQPGKTFICDTGKYMLVYRRQADSSWKVAIDMFSSDGPTRLQSLYV